MHELTSKLLKFVDYVLIFVLIVLLLLLVIYHFIRNDEDKEELKNKIIYFMTAEFFGACLLFIAKIISFRYL